MGKKWSIIRPTLADALAILISAMCVCSSVHRNRFFGAGPGDLAMRVPIVWLLFEGSVYSKKYFLNRHTIAVFRVGPGDEAMHVPIVWLLFEGSVNRSE